MGAEFQEYEGKTTLAFEDHGDTNSAASVSVAISPTPLAAGRGDAVLFADSLEERKDDDQEAKRHCVSLDGDAFLDDGHNGKRREENVAAVKTGTSSAHDARGESVAEGHKPVSPTPLAGGRGDATPTPDKAYDGVEAVDSVPSAEPAAAATAVAPGDAALELERTLFHVTEAHKYVVNCKPSVDMTVLAFPPPPGSDAVPVLDASGENAPEGHTPISPTPLAGGKGDATPTPDIGDDAENDVIKRLSWQSYDWLLYLLATGSAEKLQPYMCQAKEFVEESNRRSLVVTAHDAVPVYLDASTGKVITLIMRQSLHGVLDPDVYVPEGRIRDAVLLVPAAKPARLEDMSFAEPSYWLRDHSIDIDGHVIVRKAGDKVDLWQTFG